MKSYNERIEEFRNIVLNSPSTVFFGGAGVSTESGIPDFRSKNGLYNQHDVNFDKFEPEYLLSHTCLEKNPKIFYEFYRQKLDVRSFEPNDCHKILAKMEEKNLLKCVITQNIDGLHQKAGSKNVLEIHGTTSRVYCNKCGKEFDTDYIFNSKEDIPRCECGGLIRPDVTLYEENLPDAYNKAYEVVQNAAVLIVGGTSLKVFPASFLVSYFTGSHLIIINNQVTDYDDYADLIFHENLGQVFRDLNI